MLKYQSKLLLFVFCSLLCWILSPKAILANGGKLGMHILQPEEITKVRGIFEDEAWRYVTIPLTLEDTNNWQRWQVFFDEAHKQRLIPIIRLATTYDSKQGFWLVPTRKDIVTLVAFLSSLNWHQQEKLVIIFNEVNHTKEWGGKTDPFAYTHILKFTSNWLRSENLNYKVLPAAMDLAASNTYSSMEAFSYLGQMHSVDSEIFEYVDYWNSHSYPNPGFSSSPKRTGKNSLRGFDYELNYLKNKTNRDYQVFITETGWLAHYLINFYLSDYYLYALQHIWSDDRVKAVTPFVMRGSPGPFASFSFFDADEKPTVHAYAVKKALEKLLP
jgi:hypothetical protein